MRNSIDNFLKNQLIINIIILVFNWLFFGTLLFFLLKVSWIIIVIIYCIIALIDFFIIKSIIAYSTEKEYQQLQSMFIMLIIFNLPCAIHLVTRFRGNEFIIRDTKKYYELIAYKPDSVILIPSFEYLLRYRENQDKIYVKSIGDNKKLVNNLLTGNQIFYILPIIFTLLLLAVLYSLYTRELGIVLPLEFLTVLGPFMLSYIEVLFITLFENIVVRVEVRENRIANAIAIFNSFSFMNINILYGKKLNEIYQSIEIIKNDTSE